MQSDYSELVERLKTWRPGSYQGWIDQTDEAATAITTLQAELAEATANINLKADFIDATLNDLAAQDQELAEARNQALEDAAQEADKWFPANSAAKYPAGGIAAAIRAMKDKP